MCESSGMAGACYDAPRRLIEEKRIVFESSNDRGQEKGNPPVDAFAWEGINLQDHDDLRLRDHSRQEGGKSPPLRDQAEHEGQCPHQASGNRRSDPQGGGRRIWCSQIRPACSPRPCTRPWRTLLRIRLRVPLGSDVGRPSRLPCAEKAGGTPAPRSYSDSALASHSALAFSKASATPASWRLISIASEGFS